MGCDPPGPVVRADRRVFRVSRMVSIPVEKRQGEYSRLYGFAKVSLLEGA